MTKFTLYIFVTLVDEVSVSTNFYMAQEVQLNEHVQRTSRLCAIKNTVWFIRTLNGMHRVKPNPTMSLSIHWTVFLVIRCFTVEQNHDRDSHHFVVLLFS